MANQEQIKKMLDDAIQCDKKIELGKVIDIILGVCTQLMEDNHGIIGEIKYEMGGRAVKELTMTFVGSVVGSLYSNLAFNNLEDALKYAREHGCSEIKVAKPESEEEDDDTGNVQA